ncbi:MAG: DNA-directed RNA polymerase subunit L [Candidatus Woesearchaeota archaeon]
MEIKILEEGKNKLVMEVRGHGHTLCNALKTELYNDESVNAAGYFVEHPDKGVPTFVVETNGKKKPKDAILDAVKRLSKTNEKFIEAFKKEIK